MEKIKMKSKVIAIDCDGVMLDYNMAFKDLYLNHYKQDLQIKDPHAYHATNMFGLPKLQGEELENFHKSSDEYGLWGKMPAIENAIKSVESLNKLGYTCICVTSMPEKYAELRFENLKSLGFQIERVIATSRVGSENPKKKYIEELNPEYFIDDLQRNFEGIETDTTLVLIDRNHSDKPNEKHKHIPYDLKFNSLEGFVFYLIEKELKEKVDYSWDNWLSGDDSAINLNDKKG